jgi:hypothetical protein
MLDTSSSESDSPSLAADSSVQSENHVERVQSEPASHPPRHEVAPDRDTRDRPTLNQDTTKFQRSRFKPWQYTKPKMRRPHEWQRFDHTAPISALRDRDLSALSALFDRYAMPEIESDIHRVLILLPPEPCWEDEDLEFIKHPSAAES